MNSTTRDAGVQDAMIVQGPDDIGRLEWRQIPGCPGVRAQDLWRRGDLHDALISYQPGGSTPGRPHPGAHHHIWVVSGSASMAGRSVAAGSYVYVPPGTAHPIAAGEQGCLLLQMHRPL